MKAFPVSCAAVRRGRFVLDTTKKPTSTEITTAIMTVATASASPGAALAIGGLLGIVGLLRRSELVARTIDELGAGDIADRVMLTDYRAGTAPRRPTSTASRPNSPSNRLGGWWAGLLSQLTDDGYIEAEVRPVPTPRDLRRELDESLQEGFRPVSPVLSSPARVIPSESLPERMQPETAGVLSVREFARQVNTNIDDYPHVVIFGPSGSAKTLLAEVLVRERGGEVVVLDPKRPQGWRGAKWGGIPYCSIDLLEDGTVSYSPMVKAAREVVLEMKRRYLEQETRSIPFQSLTLIIDEGKALADLAPEIAEAYREIVSIGREVAVRIILISTTDRARKLGFDGEADSLDSFARVDCGGFAVKRLPEVAARGDKKYHWCVATMGGDVTPVANEQSFDLARAATPAATVWQGVRYNCQVPPALPAPKRVSPARDAALLEDLLGAGSVKGLGLEVAKEVAGSGGRSETPTLSAPQPLPPTSSAVKATSTTNGQMTIWAASSVLEGVPASERKLLGEAVKQFTQHKRLTPVIKAVWGVSGGRAFVTKKEWLEAALTVARHQQLTEE